MGLSWCDIEAKNPVLGYKLLVSVLSNASIFKPQYISLTLLSLNKMGLTWVDIESKKDLKEVIIEKN